MHETNAPCGGIDILPVGQSSYGRANGTNESESDGHIGG
jgi:hypothetical protein